MADVSGAYGTWLATPRSTRTQFLVVTPDTRWPQGATRAAQQAEAPASTGTLLPAGRYMRNRPTGEDPPAEGWGQSMYDHRRWGFIRENSNQGTLVEMDVDEGRLLAAEGYIRQFLLILFRPAEYRPHPGQQFLGTEGLGDVVIRADIQAQ